MLKTPATKKKCTGVSFPLGDVCIRDISHVKIRMKISTVLIVDIKK